MMWKYKMFSKGECCVIKNCANYTCVLVQVLELIKVYRVTFWFYCLPDKCIQPLVKRQITVIRHYFSVMILLNNVWHWCGILISWLSRRPAYHLLFCLLTCLLKFGMNTVILLMHSPPSHIQASLFGLWQSE